MHYPIPDELYENFIGSRWRPTLCHPEKAFALDITYEKVKGPNTKMSNFLFSIKLGFDYDEESQSYYTRDVSKVTCGQCKRVIAAINGKHRLDLKAKIRKHKDRIIANKKAIDQAEWQLAVKRSLDCGNNGKTIQTKSEITIDP